jgi:hypothetical protein
VIGLRQKTARAHWLFRGQNAAAVVLKHCGHRGIERPAEMLAGTATVERSAVVIEHFVIKRMFAKRRRANADAGCDIPRNLAW